MQAKDVMTSPVATVSLDTTVIEIAKGLLARKISAMPVVDAEGRVVGIVSEGDLMHRAESGGTQHRSWWLALMASADERAQEFVKNHGRCASDIMTRKPVTVGEDASLEEIATLLETHRIKRVPVLRDGKLVGIVSRANLLQGIVARQHAAETSADDQVLREKILSALRDSGAQTQLVSVVVSGGVVQLWGAVNTDVERDAVRVAAESVPGVKSVERQVGIFPPIVQATMGAD